MAYIDDSFEIEKVSLNDLTLIATGSDDPTVGAGVEAPIGSLYLRTTGTLYRKTGLNNVDWTGVDAANVAGTFDATKEPTGIVDRGESEISFNASTRQFTIAPLPPTVGYRYYIHGVLHTISTSKSVVIPNTTGLNIIYLDPNENLNVSPEITQAILSDNTIVSAIYYNATLGESVYFSDERHGITMDGATHYYLHTNIGAQYGGGFAVGDLLPDYSGDADDQTQLSISNGTLYDEDVRHDVYNTGGALHPYDLEQQLSAPAQLPVIYRVGTPGEWYIKPADDFPFIYSGTAGYVGTGYGLPAYNDFTGITWQLTEVPDNHYFFIHILATNDIQHPVVAIQGTATYDQTGSRDTAKQELGALTGLPFAEYTPLASLVYQANQLYTNTPKARLVTDDLGNALIDWRKTNTFSTATSTQGITNHGNLSGLGNDDHPQYLNVARGDTRYYTQTQVDYALLHIDHFDLLNKGTNTHVQIDAHIADTNNPHNVTANQVLPTQGGNGGKYLSTNGSNPFWATLTLPQLYNEKVGTLTTPAAQANNSIALGSGAQTDPTAVGSLAIGDQSLARIPGGVVAASGRFGSSGDCQYGKYLLRTHTINAVTTEAFIDGTSGSTRLTLPDNSTWTFTVTVTGHRTDINNGHAGYKFTGVVYRDSGANTIAFQGSPVKQILAESNAAWDANVSVNATSGALTVFVTGQAGKTVRWAALVETVEVTN